MQVADATLMRAVGIALKGYQANLRCYHYNEDNCTVCGISPATSVVREDTDEVVIRCKDHLFQQS